MSEAGKNTPNAGPATPQSGARLRRRRVSLVVLAALLLAGLAFGLLRGAGGSRIDARLSEKRAAPAPAFRLPVLASGPVSRLPSARVRAALGAPELSLARLEGHPLVLNFWASWCQPCREEAAVLAAGWLRDRALGVIYLGVNTEDQEGDAKAFLAKYGVTYPSVREAGSTVARSYGGVGIPETYFVDRQARVVAHVIGALSAGVLAEGVRAARAGVVLGVISGGDLRSPR